MLRLSSDSPLKHHHCAQATSFLSRELPCEDLSSIGMRSQKKHFDLNEQF
jgi:hypothetical protein